MAYTGSNNSCWTVPPRFEVSSEIASAMPENAVISFDATAHSREYFNGEKKRFHHLKAQPLSCEHISSWIFWISLWLFNDFNIFESINPILLRLCLVGIIIVMMITDVRKIYRGWPHIRISAKIVQGTNYVRVKICTTRRNTCNVR